MGNVPEKNAGGASSLESNVVLRTVSTVLKLWRSAADKLKAVLDLYLLHKQPKFFGEKKNN